MAKPGSEYHVTELDGLPPVTIPFKDVKSKISVPFISKSHNVILAGFAIGSALMVTDIKPGGLTVPNEQGPDGTAEKFNNVKVYVPAGTKVGRLNVFVAGSNGLPFCKQIVNTELLVTPIIGKLKLNIPADIFRLRSKVPEPPLKLNITVPHSPGHNTGLPEKLPVGLSITSIVILFTEAHCPGAGVKVT